jgi:hypothetical protein
MRFTIPYAPTAISPPYAARFLFISMMITQVTELIRKGDKPIEKIPFTISFFKEKNFFENA